MIIKRVVINVTIQNLQEKKNEGSSIALSTIISTEEDEVEAPVGDELVDEQPLLLLEADAHEPDEVPVLQLGHQRELVLQLLRSLRRAVRQPLHRYFLAVGEDTLNKSKPNIARYDSEKKKSVQFRIICYLVHSTETAFAELVALIEISGGSPQGGDVDHHGVHHFDVLCFSGIHGICSKYELDK